jgi:hypothetical protein
MAYTAVSDVIVPEVFTAYMQTFTEQKSELVQSGALARDGEVDGLLGGGGITFKMPKWDDLDDTDENVSAGATGSPSAIGSVSSHLEIGVRLSRNKTYGAVDLAGILAGSDPMGVIASRFAPYWTRRAQKAVLATLAGVFADNDANDSGDYTVDIRGGAYAAGTTDFSAEAFLDAAFTMGDANEDLGIVIMHSAVELRALKNDLIEFIPQSEGKPAIKTFLGRVVLVDDGMPSPAANVYETYILGAGALRWGVGQPKVPAEGYRQPLDANGGGSDSLTTRVEWCIHPRGHAYTGTPADGGPSNATTANNLGHAASWDRVAPERKMVKIARLITREA